LASTCWPPKIEAKLSPAQVHKGKGLLCVFFLKHLFERKHTFESCGKLFREGEKIIHPTRSTGKIVSIDPSVEKFCTVQFANGEQHSYSRSSMEKFQTHTLHKKASRLKRRISIFLTFESIVITSWLIFGVYILIHRECNSKCQYTMPFRALVLYTFKQLIGTFLCWLMMLISLFGYYIFPLILPDDKKAPWNNPKYTNTPTTTPTTTPRDQAAKHSALVPSLQLPQDSGHNVDDKNAAATQTDIPTAISIPPHSHRPECDNRDLPQDTTYVQPLWQIGDAARLRTGGNVPMAKPPPHFHDSVHGRPCQICRGWIENPNIHFRALPPR